MRYSIYLFAICLFASGQASAADWPQSPSAPLHVMSGQIKKINPGSIRSYSEINIESGGVLQIRNGSNRITFVRSWGDCKIHGRVEVRGFRTTRDTISQVSPDGEKLVIELVQEALGGRGGMGRTNRAGPCIAPGGAGAIGTASYGGGGGSSGYSRTCGGPCCIMRPGNSATGRIGAPPVQLPNPVPAGGGDGGRKGKNGGFLYLRCDGQLNASSSGFDLRGDNGESGKYGYAGAGGGGGPGGHGGMLFVKYGSLTSELDAMVDGGQGGNAGASSSTDSGVADPGELGSSGYVIECGETCN